MTNNAEEKIWPCRVCGLDMGSHAWGGDENLSFTYEICDCCGAEAGLNDIDIDAVKRYRKKWIEDGCPWFFAAVKPDGWNLEKQMCQIKSRWL